MLNKPINLLRDQSAAPARRLHPDAQPTLRLSAVYVCIMLPLITIGVRLVQVQTRGVDQVVYEFSRTSESFEAIPSRDGRILGQRGEVLAEDVRRFHIAVHYRWLEEPPDPRWVKQQALKALPLKARRNNQLVQLRVREVLDQRARLWDQLATALALKPAELSQRRGEIQRRIERIVATVDARRTERFERESAGDAESEPDEAWARLWQKLKRELTTSPRRTALEPIIVQEELDYHRLVEDVPFEVAMAIETHPERFPGTRIERQTERVYPLGSLAAHVVGIRSRARPGERLKEPTGDDAASSARVGRSGLEKQYDELLSGRAGRRRIIRNRAGEIIASEIVRPPVTGHDVYVTLSLPLQQAAETILDEVVNSQRDDVPDSAGAAIVVLDVRSGQVVAMANAPRYDLNLMLRPDPDELQQVLNDPRQPMFPRSTRMAVPPGSVFKVVSSLAVLHSGAIDPDDPLVCRGYLHHPDRYRCYVYRHYGTGHGDVRLVDAITRSCNVYFFAAAEKLGPQSFIDWAQRLQLGRASGIDLPGERAGNVPHPGDTDSQGRKLAWYTGDSLGLAIGQSRLTTTPLQMARVMAAVANGGYLVTPRLLAGTQATRAAEHDLGDEGSLPRQPIVGLDAELLTQIQEGLDRVVNHPQGTAYKTVRMSDVRIAGKTGTAEVGGGRNDHAWFAGYVPSRQPRFAFAIVIENGGSGGRVAGPAARQLVTHMLDLGLLPERTRLANREQ